MPLRKLATVMLVKYMAGSSRAVICALGSSEEMGTKMPDYITAGMTVTMKVTSVAATCVLTTTETVSPMPVVQIT